MRVVCPICHQTTTWEENRHRPFCSERCRRIDLGLWASEEYRIPTGDAPSADAPTEAAGEGPAGSPDPGNGA